MFETIDQLIDAMNRLEKQQVYAFAFMGNYMPVSKPPFRYLITPMGPLPMFAPPSVENLEVDDSAYFGDLDESVLSQTIAEFEETQPPPVVNNNDDDDMADDDAEMDGLSVH